MDNVELEGISEGSVQNEACRGRKRENTENIMKEILIQVYTSKVPGREENGGRKKQERKNCLEFSTKDERHQATDSRYYEQ